MTGAAMLALERIGRHGMVFRALVNNTAWNGGEMRGAARRVKDLIGYARQTTAGFFGFIFGEAWTGIADKGRQG